MLQVSSRAGCAAARTELAGRDFDSRPESDGEPGIPDPRWHAQARLPPHRRKDRRSDRQAAGAAADDDRPQERTAPHAAARLHGGRRRLRGNRVERGRTSTSTLVPEPARAPARGSDGRARDAEGEERERLWRTLADLYPGYDRYAQKTSRRIPVVVLELSAH